MEEGKTSSKNYLFLQSNIATPLQLVLLENSAKQSSQRWLVLPKLVSCFLFSLPDDQLFELTLNAKLGNIIKLINYTIVVIQHLYTDKFILG